MLCCNPTLTLEAWRIWMAACTRGTCPKAGLRPRRDALSTRAVLVFWAGKAGKVWCASAANLKGRATICMPSLVGECCGWPALRLGLICTLRGCCLHGCAAGVIAVSTLRTLQLRRDQVYRIARAAPLCCMPTSWQAGHCVLPQKMTAIGRKAKHMGQASPPGSS